MADMEDVHLLHLHCTYIFKYGKHLDMCVYGGY